MSLNTKSIIDDFLSQKSFAVVGSFCNETKYAYKIVQSLLKLDYRTFPINSNYKEVAGIQCYPSLDSVGEGMDVVNIITPPQVSLKIVQQCKDMGIQHVWLQPGAESQEIIDFCNKNGILVLHNVCIMLEARK